MTNKLSQSKRVYVKICDRIAAGYLKPGDVISESALAKEFGLSRTPIGEALGRLAHEGVVDQVPRFGTIVRDIPVGELAELYEIREALEGMAALKAAKFISANALVELYSLCETIDGEIERHLKANADVLDEDGLRRFLAADMAFHTLIIASARNARLCKMLEQTRTVSLMFNAQRGRHAMRRVVQANEEHKAIVGALERRDEQEANRLVIKHIRLSRDQSLAEHSSSNVEATLGSLNLPDFVRRDLVSPS